MSNKNIIFVDKMLNYSRHSVEELHSQGLNNWRGWWCSAGLDTIYIDFDGNVWRGTCGQGGWIGNINIVTGLLKGPTLLNREWVVCKRDLCSCGADMESPKVKEEHLQRYFRKDSTERINDLLQQELGTVEEPTMVYATRNSNLKSVIWDIGRLCNFDCYYCSKNSHNKYDPIKSLKFLTTAYQNIQKFWNTDQARLKFTITGGEPTVYKDYLPFVKRLKEDDQIIHTTTNGSSSEEYYAELARYSDIAFSIHLDYVNRLGLDKFMNNVLAAINTTKQGREEKTATQFNWVMVRIMMAPGNLQLAKEVYQEFKQRIDDESNNYVEVDLIHKTDGGNHKLYEYNQSELDWVKAIHD